VVGKSAWHLAANPLLKIGERDHGNRDGETIWALKDVSFKVEQGEVLASLGGSVDYGYNYLRGISMEMR
jgi:hypothetical protein